MSRRIRSSAFVLFAAVAVGSVGCQGDKAKPDTASTAAPKMAAGAPSGAKSGNPAPSGAPAGAPAAAPSGPGLSPGLVAALGESTKVMPAACDKGRGYLNVAKLNELTGSIKIEEIIGKANGDKAKKEEADKAVAKLKELGISEKSVVDVAVCVGATDKDVTAAIGLNLEGTKGFEAVVDGILSLDKKNELKKLNEGGTVMYQLPGEGEGFLMAAGGKIALFHKSKEALLALAKADGAGQAAYKISANTLAFVQGGKSNDFDAFSLDLAHSGTNLELAVEATGVKLPEGFPKTGEEAEKLISEEVGKLEKEPILKPIVPDLKATKVTIAGDKVTLKMTMAVDHLKETMQAVRKDLDKVLGGKYGPIPE
jgi:hypothetical protein